MQGKFIVIDGVNGSGKTEQTARLLERMQKEGHATETVSFPRYGKRSAAAVEEYLDKEGEFGAMEEVGPKRASIFYAIDRYAASKDIRAALAAGKHLVANRYVASNMGHQGAQISDAKERTEFFRWNDDLEFNLFGIPRPDINVILHVPAEVTMTLIDNRGNEKDRHENLEHQRAAEATYLEMVSTFPGFALVECVEEGRLLSREEIHEKVWSTIKPLLYATHAQTIQAGTSLSK